VHAREAFARQEHGRSSKVRQRLGQAHTARGDLVENVKDWTKTIDSHS